MSQPTDEDRAKAAEVVAYYHRNYLTPATFEHVIAQALANERDRTLTQPAAAPGWLLSAIVEATGTHDCPVCNAGRPLADGVTCPLCAGWTTL